jgi:hypothetical protein
MARTTRRIALVGPLGDGRLAVHTEGYPLDPRDMLPTADVVLLIDKRDGDCMLFRYTAHGELAGDTPHDSARDAEAQAEIEYGLALLPWMDVPEEVTDAHDFAVRYAAERLNERE